MSYQLAIALVIGAELATVIAVTGCVTGLLRLLRFLDAGSGAEHGGTGRGPGRGEDDPPDRPSDGGGGLDQAWWPRFEHDFAAHVARSGTTTVVVERVTSRPTTGAPRS